MEHGKYMHKVSSIVGGRSTLAEGKINQTQEAGELSARLGKLGAQSVCMEEHLWTL